MTVDRTPTGAGGLRRWVRREVAGLSLRQLRSLGVGAVLAVAGLFGGLDTVDSGPTTFTAGEAHSDGQLTLTVARATVRDEIRAGAKIPGPATPGRSYLGVVTTIRNDSTEPGKLTTELELLDQPEAKAVGVYRMSDASPVISLGPKLSEQVVFVWQAPREAIQPGTDVTLRVWQKQFAELLVNYGKGWLASPTQYAQIVLPVGTP